MKPRLNPGEQEQLHSIGLRARQLRRELEQLDAQTWDLLGMAVDDELRVQADLVNDFIMNGLSAADLLQALEIR